MSSDARVRVVVADDHPFFRDGVIRGLTMSGRVEVVAEADDGREALEAIRCQPRIVNSWHDPEESVRSKACWRASSSRSRPTIGELRRRRWPSAPEATLRSR